MKILITGINFSPELTGIGKYTGEMARWLAARGDEVRVVTAPPYYPGWRVGEGYSTRRYSQEPATRLSVLRCPLYVPPRPTGLRRVLHLASFALTSAPVLLFQALVWRPDVVLVVAPPIAAAPVACLAARLGGAAAWLHVQDFEVDAAFSLGMLRSRWLQAVLRRLERRLLGRFDRVSTISGRMQERLLAKGVAPARVLLLPNWTDFSRIQPQTGENALRKRLGIAAGAPVLLYSGTLGAKQGLEMLLAVVAALSDVPGLVLLLCGEGPALAPLQRAAADLHNVRFLPLQPADALNDLMGAADIHVLPQRADAEDLVMPSKLTTMMASGRAVVVNASPGSEVARVVEGVGRVVPPGDVDAFAAAISELVADATLRARLGAAARVRAQALWDAEQVLGRAFGADSLEQLGVAIVRPVAAAGRTVADPVSP